MKRALAGLVGLVACADDDAVAIVCPDASVDAGPVVTAPELDAGPLTRDAIAAEVVTSTPRQTTLTLLRASGSARFVGVTTGPSPHVAYLVQNPASTFDLEVLPVTGGTPTVLEKGLDLFSGDGATMRGGVLAWYLGVNVEGRAPAIHLWSAAGGAKTVTTPTAAGLFWASDDGTRVAFSANATADATDIAVTNMAAPTAEAPALTGANAVNLAVSPLDCPAQIDFRGANFIGAYCTGLLPTQTQPRLVTVGADGVAVVRLDNAAAANDFDGTWLSDAAGTKLMVNDAAAGAHLIDASAAATVTGAIAKVDAAMVVPDGSALLYLAGGALEKATFADPPVVTHLLPSGVARLFTITRASKTLLYAKTDAGGLLDLFSLDLTAPAPAPIALREPVKNGYLGLTGTESHAFFVDLADANAKRVYAVPITGGPPVLLVDPVRSLAGGLDFEPSPVSTGLVFTIASSLVTGTALERSELGYVDAQRGGGLEPATTILRAQDERGAWAGNTYVFRDLGTRPGIYALALP